MRSADKVMDIVTEDPEKLKALKKDPVGELAKIVKEAKEQTPRPAYFGDIIVYRIVVGMLGTIALAAAIGAILLAGIHIQDTPPVLVALGSAAIGALAGLLTPSPTGK
jgi:hypothetical protein